MGKKPGKGSPLAVLELPFESLGRNSLQNFDLVPSDHTSGGSGQRATLRMAIEAFVTPTEAISSLLVSDPTQVDDIPAADSVPPRPPPNAKSKTPDPNDLTAGGESANDDDVEAMSIGAPVTPPEVISSPLVTSSIQVDNITADSVPPRSRPTTNSVDPHAVTKARHHMRLADTTGWGNTDSGSYGACGPSAGCLRSGHGAVYYLGGCGR
ncbi:hypothetical protein BC834DRAFT_152324 [Gloeopeniophorella convolvens]|nr:hypothetical protein BC834DRAFT_152324 [Gloeopeniophorella convolvens]